MKIVYAVTCTKNETLDIVMSNIEILSNHYNGVQVIINTENNIESGNIKVINKVGDMRSSRIALHKEAYKYSADMHWIFDSDIEITQETLSKIDSQINRLKKYSFISLYYKGDPPIPSLYTLGSSLTDFYNHKNGNKQNIELFFDDSDWNTGDYSVPSSTEKVNSVDGILRGRSYARDIPEFTNEYDEHDFTTGGASIYFDKELLLKEYEWYTYKGKSLTWYDSYRTYKISCEGYKFAKVPVFVNHKRHNKTIQLSWDAVDRYIKGYGLYTKAMGDDKTKALTVHTNELIHYIKGMVKKISNIELTNSENYIISCVDEFIKESEETWY